MYGGLVLNMSTGSTLYIGKIGGGRKNMFQHYI